MSTLRRRKRGSVNLSLGKKHKRAKYDITRATSQKKDFCCQTEIEIETCSHSSQTDIRTSNSSVQASVEFVNRSVQYNLIDTGSADKIDLVAHELFNHPSLRQFLEKLDSENQLDTFFIFVQLVSYGSFNLHNIAWLALLDRVKWQNCTSTTSIVYNKHMKEFWNLIQNMFGSSVLNVLRGPGHFGQVVTEETHKSVYNPDTGICNFAIPSTRTLNRIKTDYPKTITPGFIEQTLEICAKQSSEGKQFVLSFDAKMLASGLKDKTNGDINLLGFEGPPSLSSRLQMLQCKLEEANRFQNLVNLDSKDITQDQVNSIKSKLLALVPVLSKQLRLLRHREMGQSMLQQRLVRLATNNPDNKNYYSSSMSRVNLHEWELCNLITRIQELNFLIFRTIAHIAGTENSLPLSRHVEMSESSNVWRLLPPDIVKTLIDNSGLHIVDWDNNIKDTLYLKQGTEEWKKKRKLAKVTGSSLFRALGFDTLKNQKSHFHEFVRKNDPPARSKEIQKILNHGIDNEINGLASVVGCLLPTLRPPCFNFFEVGPVFEDGINVPNFLEVSADGLMDCVNGGIGCPHASETNHRRIALEIKCPYPEGKICHQPFYKLPVRYVPQVLANMYAHSATELWFVSFTTKGVSVCSVTFDAQLWIKLKSIASELYDVQDSPIPTRLHFEVKSVRQQMSDFVKSNSKFVAEIPPLFGSESIVHVGNLPSPFGVKKIPQDNHVNIETLKESGNKIIAESKSIFTSVHELLREEATEVGVFMLSDKDRKHEEGIPNSLPVAYIMKGPSLPNSTLRSILNMLLVKLRSRNINVLCEAYDGEWGNLVMNDKSGFPLTRLGLAKLTWSRISKMSKEKCIEEMCDTCKIRQGDHDILQFTKIKVGLTELNNVTVLKKCNGSIHLKSKGGTLFPECVSTKFVCDTRAELWAEHKPEDEPEKVRKSKAVGLLPDEKNLLSLLNPDLVEQIEADCEKEVHVDLEDENFLPDLDEPISLLQRTLTHENFRLLQDIVHELQLYDFEKWENLTVDDLFPDLLQIPAQLSAACTIKDLQVIARVMESCTGRAWWKSSMRKAAIVNTIAKAFDGKNFLEIIQKESRNINTPKSLQNLCKYVIMDKSYPTVSVQSSLAKVHHSYTKPKWESKCHVRKHHYIPGTGIVPIYSLPEYDETNGTNHFRSLDYSHIMNNIRSHIVKGLYDFFDTQAYIHMADHAPDIVSRGVILGNSDPQNVAISQRFFSNPVSTYFEENGFQKEADFVRLVRAWFLSCDMRGIGSDSRVQSLYEIHKFLTENINFDQFPVPIGKNVRGMPVTTFEALLQSISTRISLFEFAEGSSYNQRAISTLSNESFFSDMTRLDKQGSRYLKSTSVPGIFGKSVQLNYFKHKPNKIYALSATMKNVYPVHHTLEMTNELQQANIQSFYRDHFFDLHDMHVSQRVRKDDITRGRRPLRCVEGVRKFHRTDESLILAETRAGRPVKGFPKPTSKERRKTDK